MTGSGLRDSTAGTETYEAGLAAALSGHAATRRLATWRVALESAGVMIVTALLYLPYLSQPTFLDEFDNMIGGNVVANGGTIYIDYLSQHTPVAYWLSGLGYLLGANHFGGQRLFGYLLFALLLALVYARNVRSFGRIPLLVVVMLIPMLHAYNPEYSYSVLSDNYQAIAFVAILLDVVAIGVFRDRSGGRWLSLGLASALAVGVAFVAIYFVFGAVIVAAALTIVDGRPALRGVGVWTRFVGLRVLMFGIPFLALLAVLATTGSLIAAYGQAYVLNRDYYSPYILGLGSDAVAPIYAGLFEFAAHLGGLPGQIAVSPQTGIRDAMAMGVLAATTVVLYRIRPTLGLGVLWMASLTTQRGWNGFHAQPFWSFVIACLGILGWCLLANLRWRRKPFMATGIAAASIAAVTVLAAVPYGAQVYRDRQSLLSVVPIEPNLNRTMLIESLVPEGGVYGELNVSNAVWFVITGRQPAAGVPGLVPWFADMLDSEIADSLAKESPVLIFRDADINVWGNRLDEHAPAVWDVVDRRYTLIDTHELGVSGVYVRNDAIEQSLATLRRDFPQATIEVSDLP